MNAAGTIQIDCHRYPVSTRWAHQAVLAQLDAQARCFRVFWEQRLVKQFPIAGLHAGSMAFDRYLQLARQEALTIEAHRRALWAQTGETL